MTLVRAATFAEFLAKFAQARQAGAFPVPVGGNEMILPDDTDPKVLEQLFGAVAVEPTPVPAQPAPAKAKTTRSKFGKES